MLFVRIVRLSNRLLDALETESKKKCTQKKLYHIEFEQKKSLHAFSTILLNEIAN